MANMERRFVVVYEDRIDTPNHVYPGMLVYILKDTKTGVLYLGNQYHESSGLTPLLDDNGKPVSE